MSSYGAEKLPSLIWGQRVDLLPLDGDASIAVVGRIAALPPLQGGGSSNVGPIPGPTALEGIRTLARDVRYEPGYVPSAMPRLDLEWLDGGFSVEFRPAEDPDGPPIEVQKHRNARLIFRERVADRPMARGLVAMASAAAVLLSIVQMIQYWIGILPFANTTWAQYRALFLRFQ